MQLTDLFASSLEGLQGQPAVDFDGGDGRVESLTFGALDLRARRLAQLFRHRGLRAGDRVAIYLANRVEFIDVFLACMRLGVVLVPINILYREREIAHIVADSEPAAVVTTSPAFPLFSSAIPLWDAGELTALAATLEPYSTREPIDGDAPALLVYTSGTTGRSKGAVLTHNNCLANTANLVTAWCITAQDRYLAVLPLFHVHGLANGL
ncbi:MAG: class I adenylate-forming enzyme family protein, partial [Candidatus Korobacteraceae bacterium]